MKHRLGNSPRCDECYYYIEKMENDRTACDGYCINPYNLSHGANGSKRTTPRLSEPTRAYLDCSRWEDKEERLTCFEVLTRQPEEWRTECEKEHIKEKLKRRKT